LPVMGAIWRRFSPFERVLLVAAVVAGLAAVGDLGRGDGLTALALAVIVAGACVSAAGGSRKRRLLGDRRQLGPFERVERSHPAAVAVASGAVLGLLFASTYGPALAFVFAALWIGSQLAVMPRPAAR
jgi:hypothetical protein